jgi:hypothetical protein
VVYQASVKRFSIPINSGSFWNSRQREGHSLHEISYRACFKPALAGYFIERFTRPGDVVFDPFMGRGTTPLEAALRGRVAAGSDANPLCAMLAAPRLDPPTQPEVTQWLDHFDWTRSGDAPDELLAFYHPQTLQKISALRAAFLEKRPTKPELGFAWSP